MAEDGHLLPGAVVQHLGHKAVRAVPGGVAADDIGHARLRRPVDLDKSPRIVHPPDPGYRPAVIVIRKIPHPHRLDVLQQPGGHGLGVKHGLAGNAPLAQAVDHVVILVGVAERLQRPHRLLGEKAVVPVCGLVHRGPGVAPVKEPPLEPVGNGDGVEGEDHLEVVGTLCPQADVELVKVGLQQLRRLLNPYPGDVVDGFELFHVVQSGKKYLGAVWEHNAQLSPVDHGPAVRVVLGKLPPELSKAALPQGLGHLAAH